MAAGNGRHDPIVVESEVRAKPSVRIETVTPTKAEKWLGANTHNRALREHRVLMLANTIQQGEWELTPDAIAFDSTGVLLNGQHRLSACVVAEVPILVAVMRGVPAKAQEVMDTGLKRSLRDALKLRGVRNSTNVGATLGYLHRLEYMWKTGKVHYHDYEHRPTTRELLTRFEKEADVIEAMTSQAKMLSADFPLRPGPTAAIWYHLALIDSTEADLFFSLVASGIGLEAGSPIAALRKQVYSSKGDRRDSKLPDYREMAIVTKAWNYWREGRSVTVLNWHFSPTQRDAFPVPR